MKVAFDTDRTPEEARGVLGLVDVESVNEALIEELIKRADEMAQSMYADTMIEQRMTVGFWGADGDNN